MSSSRDEIARRVAARLAPEVGPKLPVYVERLIALGDDADDEAPVQRDVASVAAVASVLMAAITIALGRVDRYRDEQRRLQEEQQRQAEDRRRQAEEQCQQDDRDRALALAESAIALTREVLAREIRAGVRFPDEVPTKVRIALVEQVAAEGIEEAKRREGER